MSLIVAFGFGFTFWIVVSYICRLKQKITKLQHSNQEWQQSSHELERLVVRSWNDHHRSKQVLLTFIFRNSQSMLDFLTSSDPEIISFRNENQENIRIIHDKCKNKE